MNEPYGKNDWREDRIRAIAINAMREARVAYQRDNLPWFDDDAKRLDMIFRILHIVEIENVDTQNEHFPMVPQNQPAHNKALASVAQALASLQDFPEELSPPVEGLKPQKFSGQK